MEGQTSRIHFAPPGRRAWMYKGKWASALRQCSEEREMASEASHRLREGGGSMSRTMVMDLRWLTESMIKRADPVCELLKDGNYR